MSHMSWPTQRCMVGSLPNENWVVYGTAKIADGTAFNAKRVHSRRIEKAMSPVLPAMVHQALWMVSWRTYRWISSWSTGSGLGRDE